MYPVPSRLLILLLSLLSPYQVRTTELPTYADLRANLPISLAPGGSDQYLFFIVPVLQQDQLQDQQLVVQLAQARDHHEASTNHTIQALTAGGNHSETLSQPENLTDVFRDPPSQATGGVGFNFQVPVVVPLDLHFRYDVSASLLPECSVDTRTWREDVIANVTREMDLPGGQKLGHTYLSQRIRLVKDLLAATTPSHLADLDALNGLLTIITQCKNMTDIESGYLLNDTEQLTSDNLWVLAEGLDTYSLVESRLNMSSLVADTLQATSAKTLIDSLLSIVTETISLFQQAIATVRDQSP